MKSLKIITMLCLLAALLQPQTGKAAGNANNKTQAVGLGARYQVENTYIENLPFDDGDLTYSISYEYHDRAGYWQLMVGYAPDVGEGDIIDYVITPQLNLIIQDRIFLVGAGVLTSYVQNSETGGDWTDVYWQVMLGLEIPIGSFALEAMAYYQFNKWDDMVSDFESDDLAYGGSLKYYF